MNKVTFAAQVEACGSSEMWVQEMRDTENAKASEGRRKRKNAMQVCGSSEEREALVEGKYRLKRGTGKGGGRETGIDGTTD